MLELPTPHLNSRLLKSTCAFYFIPHNDETLGKLKQSRIKLDEVVRLWTSAILILILLSYQWFINRFWSVPLPFPFLFLSALSSFPFFIPLYFHPFLPRSSLWFFSFPTSSPSYLCLSLSLSPPLRLFVPLYDRFMCADPTLCVWSPKSSGRRFWITLLKTPTHLRERHRGWTDR